MDNFGVDLPANYKLKSINIINPPQFEYEDHFWHDRILYKTNDVTSHDIECLYYDNVYGFPMLQQGTNSHHLGVMGVYELVPVNI